MANVARNVALLSSLGAGLEYYDFIIYGMMAEQLSTLFFPSEAPWIALIKAFGVFAVGYLIRPFGGILFGLFGDTFGRKKTFVTVMLLMAISTFCIGILPTYAQIGGLASCLLILLRIMQGVSFGAELPGAITVVCEYAKKEKQGSYSGIIISSISLGSTLAAFTLYILTHSISKEQVLDWGWRIPFLMGGVLAIANYFIRNNLQETPEFTSAKNESQQTSIKEPFLNLIQNYRKEMFLGIGLTWLAASLVIFSLYLPTFLSQNYHYAIEDVYLAMMWGLIWSAISIPFCGRIADYFGKTKVFIASCIAFTLGGVPLFAMLHLGGFATLLAFMVIYQTVISFLTASYLPILSNLFSTAVRYTGTAICYNITYSIMACTPLAITAATIYFQTPDIAIWFLLAGSLISAVSALVLSKEFRIRNPEFRIQNSE